MIAELSSNKPTCRCFVLIPWNPLRTLKTHREHNGNFVQYDKKYTDVLPEKPFRIAISDFIFMLVRKWPLFYATRSSQSDTDRLDAPVRVCVCMCLCGSVCLVGAAPPRRHQGCCADGCPKGNTCAARCVQLARQAIHLAHGQHPTPSLSPCTLACTHAPHLTTDPCWCCCFFFRCFHCRWARLQNGEEWRAVRSLLNPAFHRVLLENYVQVCLHVCARVCARMAVTHTRRPCSSLPPPKH